ncbi:MAG: prepilin peptidase [Verrucomicrobia bacterium]|nr:prepilin peptidase [Verrucomicrobiota bacterium]
MTRNQILETLLQILVFMMGAGIGSFLNVVIYRLPLGISVNNPRRSFCPSCKKQIPWYHNIPLLSWLLLRGKCAECGSKIAFRYFFVELLTACLFYASLGGLVVGLMGSYWQPQIMNDFKIGMDHGMGMVMSFVSACIGLGLLWTVVELGKIAFGRIREKFEKPQAWSIAQPDENEPPLFQLGETKLGWGDIYTRASDRLVLHCTSLQVNEQMFSNVRTEIKQHTMVVHTPEGGEKFNLEGVKKLEGTATEMVIPREAMGFGDVLLLAMIGSFLGWKAVLFTVVAGSTLGTLFAVGPRLIGKTEWGSRIPFGPYLAAGGMIWLFYGPQFLEWYLGKLHLGQ